MTVSFDGSDLNRLVADLTRAEGKVVEGCGRLVKRGAQNVKTEAQQMISGLRHAPHYPRSIGYDITTDRLGITAEIGPDKSRPQGALGNILEYGTSKNPPFAHLGPALDREGPRFAQALADLAGDAL